MKLVVEKTERLNGSVRAPPSKSHTHRAILVASLGTGESVVKNPLECDDSVATIHACKMFGAKIEGAGAPTIGDVGDLIITGVEGKPNRSDSDVHVGESGTTMRFMAAAYALCKGTTIITGGDSVRSRPIKPLLDSLTNLGAFRARAMGDEGRPPVCIGGRMKGGSTAIDGDSSQYLSALLLTCPLAGNDSMISVKGLRSEPYVRMTMEHLERAGARVWSKDIMGFFVPGGQIYKPTVYSVPGDHSSAAYLAAAAEITNSEIEILGLDSGDSQGDKSFREMMKMILAGGDCDMDMGDVPDLLPILAVMGCHGGGVTTLKNVPHARRKESDRISAICAELRKMGADIAERPDGLVIKPSKLRGAELDGHGDHRIVMALAVAGLAADGRTIISCADAISKSYPGFASDLAELGANIRKVDE